MTDKQKRFADEYLIDCNATRAYKSAYPHVKSDRVAQVNGSRLLLNAMVKNYISEQLEKIHNEKVADSQEVMEYLSSVLRGKSTSEVVVIEGYGDGCSGAKRMDKAPDEKEKLKAAELLGKRYGMFKDNVNITGAVSVVIEDDIDNDD